MSLSRSRFAHAYALLFAICLTASAVAQQPANIPADAQNAPANGKFLLASSDPNPASPSSAAAPAAASKTPGATTIAPVLSTVEVVADGPSVGLATESTTQHMTQAELLSAAGTFGDFTRHLQLMPGVVWNSDQSNDVLVRGGHPSENLFVIDGIEIPNLNQIAVEGSSGGFTSMVDTATVAGIDMKAGVYDAKFSSRLSSLIDIHTIGSEEGTRGGQVNFGISGVGVQIQHPLGPHASLLTSFHRSILNLVTNNIGLNGTPVYTNGLARLEWTPNPQDRVSVLSLSGVDSIDINPCAGDVVETLNINTQYAGWRSTDGLVWQHIHNPQSVSTLTASYSAQDQHIGQQEQDSNGQYHNTVPGHPCEALVTTDVYKEKTRDGVSTVAYSFQHDHRGWLLSGGFTGRLTSLNYAVAQPNGEQSPFDVDSTRADAISFTRDFSTGQSGVFLEANGHIFKRWTAMAGVREETFALAHAAVFEPRASTAFRISRHQSVSAEYGRSGQLAPYMDMLSYTQNASLKPVQVEQYSVGADLWRADWGTLSAEAYRKRYFDEPVSTEYPSLMLANMVDTLGQQFVWLPLKTDGHGRSEGLDMMLRTNFKQRLQLLASVTYARTRYAAADGVMRPGNYDVPLVTNGMVTAKLPAKLELSLRNTYASGRPYTPFDIPASEAQFRGIYDLSKVNAPRGSAYNRMDVEVSRNIRIRGRLLNIHGGADNLIDRKNLLGYAWLDRCPPGAICRATTTPAIPPTARLYQMPFFPLLGARYDY